LVPEDTVDVARRVSTNRGWLTYEFPVAGLTSWLCLKSDAIMRRDKPKDSYDVVWTLDALGPDHAAELIMSSPLMAGNFADDVVTQLRMLIDDQFKDTISVGPKSYADFLGADAASIERRHAQGTVAALAAALRGLGFGS
jgi:hypothetical protein